MEIKNTPVLGGPAPRNAVKTAEKLAGFALKWVASIRDRTKGSRYLDVGCGNGVITEIVAPSFNEVIGVDIEEKRLEDFRAHASDKSNIKALRMSAAKIEFPTEFFSFITSFEVLEHVEDLNASVREMVRVCRRGGVIVVSVPQVWFPFENHGARFGMWIYSGKVPILPYVRPLHKKYALARIFSSAEIDRLFLLSGMELLGTSYAAPQFERAAAQANSWERRVLFLKHILDRCETIPVLRALTGVSILKAYRKLG